MRRYHHFRRFVSIKFSGGEEPSNYKEQSKGMKTSHQDVAQEQNQQRVENINDYSENKDWREQFVSKIPDQSKDYQNYQVEYDRNGFDRRRRALFDGGCNDGVSYFGNAEAREKMKIRSGDKCRRIYERKSSDPIEPVRPALGLCRPRRVWAEIDVRVVASFRFFFVQAQEIAHDHSIMPFHLRRVNENQNQNDVEKFIRRGEPDE